MGFLRKTIGAVLVSWAVTWPMIFVAGAKWWAWVPVQAVAYLAVLVLFPAAGSQARSDTREAQRSGATEQ
jgi:cell division protein FtsW (lipid II flippase)